MRRALVMVITCIMALFVAMPAFASSPGIDRLSVNVTVLPSSSLRVVEQQTVTLSPSEDSYQWNLYAGADRGFDASTELVVNRVSIVMLDKDGLSIGEPVVLTCENPYDGPIMGPEAPARTEPEPEPLDESAEPAEEPAGEAEPKMQAAEPETTGAEDEAERAEAPATSMADAEAPQPSFSFDRTSGVVKCTFPDGITAMLSPAVLDAATSTADGTSDVTVLIQAEYTAVHCMDFYRDVAELNWRYVNTELPAVREASLTVVLPVPDSALPTDEGGDVLAWGHGPGHGTFSVQSDGTVAYRINDMPASNYAEAHVIFPVTWVDASHDPLKQHSELHRTEAIAQEENWVDAEVRNTLWDDRVRMLFLGIAVIVLLPGIVSVIRNGRSPKARRALGRVSATIGVIALGELLFFREPVSTAALAAVAIVVAAAAFALPAGETVEPTKEDQ